MINSLINRYRTTIESVETQSCQHGDSPVLTGDLWRQNGCGAYYEYQNDICVRSEIAKAIEKHLLSPSELEILSDLDNRLKTLLEANGVSVSDSHFWQNGLPIGVSV